MLTAKVKWLALEAGDAGIDLQDGEWVVTYADPVLRVRVDWLRSHGLADRVHDDGSLVLDSAGEYRYQLVATLPDETHLYQRVGAVGAGAGRE